MKTTSLIQKLTPDAAERLAMIETFLEQAQSPTPTIVAPPQITQTKRRLWPELGEEARVKCDIHSREVEINVIATFSGVTALTKLGSSEWEVFGMFWTKKGEYFTVAQDDWSPLNQ